uniref:CCHC-type domain-containing protein n=1 Tax=Tanacetum cinerariifolium TaxID=118510 RepID=A0A699GLM5_TANCI|nr:hypothetical protein [Tanacetum cinerariifolium]
MSKHIDELRMYKHLNMVFIDKKLQEVWMDEYMNNVVSDELIHIEETEVVKIVVGILDCCMKIDKCWNKIEFADDWQLVQMDHDCAYLLYGLHLYGFHVVEVMHEADQSRVISGVCKAHKGKPPWRGSNPRPPVCEENTTLSTYGPHREDPPSHAVDFYDSSDDEEDSRRNQEYLSDLEEEYQARSLLAKSKKFFKNGTQRLSSAKATDQTECHKYGKKGHFARDCWSKSSVPSYQSPFQPKLLNSSQHKPELRPTKDFEEEVSSYDNEMVEVKVLMALAEDNDAVSKEGARNDEWVKISIKKCVSEKIPIQNNIMGVDQLTGRILPAESQRNTTDPPVAVTNSLEIDYDSADESSIYSTPLPSLKKLDGVEPASGPKTVKLILKSKSTFKVEALKGVIVNELSSAPAKGNKSSLASKVNSAPTNKLNNVNIKDDLPLAIVMKELNKLKLQISKTQSSRSISGSSSRPIIQRPSDCFFPLCINYGRIDHLSDNCIYYPICRLCGSYDHDTNSHSKIISLEREIKPRNLQHVIKRCETCGSTIHNTTDHYDIEWFKKGKALQAKNVDALNSKKTGSSKVNISKTPTRGPDIQFLTCLYARYQANPKESHFIAVKRIFRANYLAHSRYYAQTPSTKDVRTWFSSIGYGEEIKTKGTLKKAFLPSSSAMDSNPSHPSVSTLVDPTMHKEDQQETGDPTSLGVTSEDGANPQLGSGSDASADSTTEADLVKSAPNDYLPPQQGLDKGTKNYSLDYTFTDDPIIVIDEIEGDDEVDKDEGVHSTINFETKDGSASKPLSPRFTQVFNTASKKARDTSVPSAGRAGTIPTEEEKNTNQATISQLFQRRADKNAKKTNLNK